jgi:hypothetical protein
MRIGGLTLRSSATARTGEEQCGSSFVEHAGGAQGVKDAAQEASVEVAQEASVEAAQEASVEAAALRELAILSMCALRAVGG